MILKSYIVEKNLKILEDYQSIILYGENEGIKDDIKSQLKNRAKDAEVINIFQDELQKNNDLLLSNISNSSLFSEKKIIFLHEATDKIFNLVQESIEKLNADTKFYIFSNLLDKKSKLRNYFEKEKKLGIVPCYQDNERTLHIYISGQLNGYKGLNGNIINTLISNSNTNRKIIKNEIDKIKNFFIDKNIDEEQLNELLNVKSSSGFDQLRDASLLGDKQKVNLLIGNVDFLPEDNFFYISQLYARVSKLLEIKTVNNNFNDYEISIETLKLRIFWKDKPIYLAQLKRWELATLQDALNIIGKTELMMKKNSQIRNETLIKNLLVNLCSKATAVA